MKQPATKIAGLVAEELHLITKDATKKVRQVKVVIGRWSLHFIKPGFLKLLILKYIYNFYCCGLSGYGYTDGSMMPVAIKNKPTSKKLSYVILKEITIKCCCCVQRFQKDVLSPHVFWRMCFIQLSTKTNKFVPQCNKDFSHPLKLGI